MESRAERKRQASHSLLSSESCCLKKILPFSDMKNKHTIKHAAAMTVLRFSGENKITNPINARAILMSVLMQPAIFKLPQILKIGSCVFNIKTK